MGVSHTQEKAFSRRLYTEIGLIVLFLGALLGSIAEIIPLSYKTELLSALVALGIIPVFKSAVQSIKERRINVDLLATLALALSLLANELNSALFISLMLSSARILGIYTERHVERSLASLSKLKPLKARILRDGVPTTIPIRDVVANDLVLVTLGEQIPVDGVVEEGSASVDQSSLTGESVPILKDVGDTVLSATVVTGGNLTIRAEKVGRETTFEKMVRLVESSQQAKTRMRTLAERFASWYIGAMLLVAIATYLITGNLSLVLAIVLVVCADDIAIAIPLAYVASMGAAAKRGILIKSADFLERVSKITTLIVDKTGTLTLGSLTVRNVHHFGEASLMDTLKLSGVMCYGSTHPVAKAIIRYAQERNITCNKPEKFEEIEGRGIRGTSQNKEVIIGRPEFLEDQGVAIHNATQKVIEEEVARGNTVTLIAVNGKVLGLFALADEIRPGIDTTIKKLESLGIKSVVMLTGDNERVASEVARATGITKYHASLLPEHKVSILKSYLKPRKTVAMIGDGVNDAAVLARSDIGIAMGGIGSDAAIDAADIVLMKDDFTKMLELREISKKVVFVAKSNFALWAILNIIGLYFVFTGVFDPSKAALYNFLTDFIPLANSLRLFRYAHEPERAKA